MQALPTSRRGRRLAALAVPAAAAAVWAPSLVAEAYDGDGFAGAPGVDYLTNPQRGWEFLVDSVRLSRDTALGTSTDAMTKARDVWAGQPAVATRVRLVAGATPFRVEIPGGGTAPAAAKAEARPRSELSWVVLGSVRGGPEQPVGILDYHSGRVAWDIRPLPEERR